MITTVLPLAALLASPGWTASRFVTDLRKAESRKEPDERVEWYSRAIEEWDPKEDPNLLAQCRFGRGQARVELWRFSEAEPDLAKALELDPGNHRARLLRGQALLELGRAEAAVEDLIDYTGMEPDDEQGWLSLAQAKLKLGREDQALKACRRAQKVEDADSRAWLCEGRVLLARRDWAAAEAALTSAAGKAPSLPETFAERAVSRVAQGRHEQAVKDYQAALAAYEAELKDLSERAAPQPRQKARRQETARAYFGSGRVREFLSQVPQAIADYQRACELGHDDACARLQALAPEQAAARAKPAPPPAPAPPKPAKRKRLPAPRSDPGERIYGS